MKRSALGFRNSNKLTRLLLCSASGLVAFATPQVAFANELPEQLHGIEAVLGVGAEDGFGHF